MSKPKIENKKTNSEGKIIKICTEMSPTDPAKSLRAALDERPDNFTPPGAGFAQGGLAAALAGVDAPAIAAVYTKLWQNGRTLDVAFLGNVNPQVKQKIIKYASLWMKVVNLRFKFVAGNAGQIRITTTPGGSWSYIGTDARTIAAGSPTMNFGWLTPTTADAEYSRVVLHEFGHAIGCIHEHQHPAAGIPWDRPAVYAYYAQQGWNQQQVDNNIFARYSHTLLNASAYDRASIMHYAVPNELTLGNYEVGWNRVLSTLDKTHMRRVYPF